MPIFRKIVTETSTAIFDIKADTKAEADEAFERKFRDPDREGDYDEYRDLMNSQCEEKVVDLQHWDNESKIGRASCRERV